MRTLTPTRGWLIEKRLRIRGKTYVDTRGRRAQGQAARPAALERVDDA